MHPGLALGLAVLVALLSWARPVMADGERQDWDWQRDGALPAWMPPPVVPADNPMTRAKVELGRHLFYDKRLSADGSMACATCHRQANGFADPRRVATGVDGSPGQLNPPSIVNSGYLPVLTWANPGQRKLEQQALIPLFSQHPIEMGMAGREAEMMAALRREPRYTPLFAAAFPQREDPISLDAITKAIAAFERSVTSFRSPYDRARRGNEPDAITPAARRGEALFFGERLECYHCHGGPTFSDNLHHVRLAEPEVGFHDTGVARRGGVGEQTGDGNRIGAFRTPSLRNVALTAPYMHDGSMATLNAVIDHYAKGGRSRGPNTSPLLQGFRLSARERADLIAFLESLTDVALANDPRWADPWAERRTK